MTDSYRSMLMTPQSSYRSLGSSTLGSHHSKKYDISSANDLNQSVPSILVSGANASDDTAADTVTKKRKEFKHSASSSLITYGPKKDTFYALKSIHLDRCTTPAFVKELKNEGK